MLAAGEMTVEEAASLLEALGADRQTAGQAEQARPRPAARHLIVSIGRTGGAEGAEPGRGALRVRVPVALARFAVRFLPVDARAELDANGVDLKELLDAIEGDLPDGKILDMEVGGDDRAAAERTHILIEVA